MVEVMADGAPKLKVAGMVLIDLLDCIERKKIPLQVIYKKSLVGIISKGDGIIYFKADKWTVGVYIEQRRFDFIDSFCRGGVLIDSGQIGREYPEVNEYAERYKDLHLARRVWGVIPGIFD